MNRYSTDKNDKALKVFERTVTIVFTVLALLAAAVYLT
jgi:hypothetical protein